MMVFNASGVRGNFEAVLHGNRLENYEYHRGGWAPPTRNEPGTFPVAAELQAGIVITKIVNCRKLVKNIRFAKLILLK